MFGYDANGNLANEPAPAQAADSRTGPFTLGQDKSEAIAALNHYGRDFILTTQLPQEVLEETYFTRIRSISPRVRALLMASDVWRVAFHEQDATVVYEVQFHQGRAASVVLASTPAA